MKGFAFAFKKALRSPVYLLFLLAILLLPPIFFALGRESGMPGAGYVLEGGSDRDGARLADYLLEAGFQPYTDRDELYQAVSSGSIDAGIVIPDNLSALLKAGRFENALECILAEDAAFPDLWKEEAASALFAVYAPYISVNILEEEGIDPETVLAEYWARMDAAYLFHFELSQKDGPLVLHQERSLRFFLFALSLILFLAAFFACAQPAIRLRETMAARLSRRQSLLALFLPSWLLRALGLGIAGLLSCLLAGQSSLVLPVLLYWLLVMLFSGILVLLPGDGWKALLIYFICLLGLVLSPLFIDLSLLLPQAAGLRYFLPPLWLWLLAGM